MAKLAIMCGLPRSGKTTLAKELEREGWVRVSPDDIRLALHSQPFVKEAESTVWAVARDRSRRLLQSDHKVLIDATNLSKESRGSWSKLAKEFGLSLDIYLVETPFEICLKRNIGTGAVPEDVLRRMNERYQRPTDKEGRIIVSYQFDGQNV
jgi:predicted kinase